MGFLCFVFFGALCNLSAFNLCFKECNVHSRKRSLAASSDRQEYSDSSEDDFQDKPAMKKLNLTTNFLHKTTRVKDDKRDKKVEKRPTLQTVMESAAHQDKRSVEPMTESPEDWETAAAVQNISPTEDRKSKTEESAVRNPEESAVQTVTPGKHPKPKAEGEESAVQTLTPTEHRKSKTEESAVRNPEESAVQTVTPDKQPKPKAEDEESAVQNRTPTEHPKPKTEESTVVQTRKTKTEESAFLKTEESAVQNRTPTEHPKPKTEESAVVQTRKTKTEESAAEESAVQNITATEHPKPKTEESAVVQTRKTKTEESSVQTEKRSVEPKPKTEESAVQTRKTKTEESGVQTEKRSVEPKPKTEESAVQTRKTKTEESSVQTEKRSVEQKPKVEESAAQTENRSVETKDKHTWMEFGNEYFWKEAFFSLQRQALLENCDPCRWEYKSLDVLHLANTDPEHLKTSWDLVKQRFRPEMEAAYEAQLGKIIQSGENNIIMGHPNYWDAESEGLERRRQAQLTMVTGTREEQTETWESLDEDSRKWAQCGDDVLALLPLKVAERARHVKRLFVDFSRRKQGEEKWPRTVTPEREEKLPTELQSGEEKRLFVDFSRRKQGEEKSPRTPEREEKSPTELQSAEEKSPRTPELQSEDDADSEPDSQSWPPCSQLWKPPPPLSPIISPKAHVPFQYHVRATLPRPTANHAADSKLSETAQADQEMLPPGIDDFNGPFQQLEDHGSITQVEMCAAKNQEKSSEIQVQSRSGKTGEPGSSEIQVQSRSGKTGEPGPAANHGSITQVESSAAYKTPDSELSETSAIAAILADQEMLPLDIGEFNDQMSRVIQEQLDFKMKAFKAQIAKMMAQANTVNPVTGKGDKAADIDRRQPNDQDDERRPTAREKSPNKEAVNKSPKKEAVSTEPTDQAPKKEAVSADRHPTDRAKTGQLPIKTEYQEHSPKVVKTETSQPMVTVWSKTEPDGKYGVNPPPRRPELGFFVNAGTHQESESEPAGSSLDGSILRELAPDNSQCPDRPIRDSSPCPDSAKRKYEGRHTQAKRRRSESATDGKKKYKNRKQDSRPTSDKQGNRPTSNSSRSPSPNVFIRELEAFTPEKPPSETADPPKRVQKWILNSPTTAKKYASYKNYVLQSLSPSDDVLVQDGSDKIPAHVLEMGVDWKEFKLHYYEKEHEFGTWRLTPNKRVYWVETDVFLRKLQRDTRDSTNFCGKYRRYEDTRVVFKKFNR